MDSRMLKYIIWLLFFCVMADTLLAVESDSLKKQEAKVMEADFTDLENAFVSLDSIIAVAMDHSPYLKFDSAMVVAQGVDIKLSKRSFYNNVSGFFNYSTGNQRFLVAGNGGSESQNGFLNGYRLGVNLSIPLGEFTNRNLKIKRETAEYNAQKFRQDQTEVELKRQITQEYNNLVASQKVLKIKSAGLETARMLLQLGEKQFREGTISLQDYASVSDMAIRAEVDYELAKSGFRSSYYNFQDLVGVPLTSLMKKK